MPSLPVGDFVPSVSEVRVPRRVDYEGEYIALSPLNPERDAPGVVRLFAWYGICGAVVDVYGVWAF